MSHPSPPRRLASLADVAAAAGVSTASASKVLRGITAGTHADTRARIQAAADRLGYRRNRLVEGMQTGRSLTIGVVVPPWGEFTRRLADAIHAHCARDGLLPLFHWAQPHPRLGATAAAEDAAEEAAALYRLLDRRVDGLLLYPAADGALSGHVATCAQRGVPVVAMDRCPADHTGDVVTTDDAAGAYAAARHLVGLGHRQILHLAGEQRYATYRQRATVMQQTIQAVGGTCHLHEVPNAELDRLAEHAHAALRAAPMATAVTLGSDVFAPALYRAAHDLGRPVGTRLAVIGFAGLSLVDHLHPALSSVHQDPEALGRTATRLLQERLAQPDLPPRRPALPTHLVLRASTGAP